MARYRRNSLRWMSQPRGMDGRWQPAVGGGGNDEDPLGDWFSRAEWWKKLLAIVALVAFCLWLYASGYILVFLLGAWALIGVMKLITAWLNG